MDNHAKTEIDLDALELEYTPKRHDIGDDRVVALIQRLREAENATPNLKEWFANHDSVLISVDELNQKEARIAQLEQVLRDIRALSFDDQIAYADGMIDDALAAAEGR